MCKNEGNGELLRQIDNTMHLGSSGLEILGSIRHFLITNRDEISQILGAEAENDMNQIIAFVDSAYGRRLPPAERGVLE